MSQVQNTQTAVLPEKLARQVRSQFTAFNQTDMTAYTYGKTKSEFLGAKSDLSVYDGSGKLMLVGRDFGDRIFFWQP